MPDNNDEKDTRWLMHEMNCYGTYHDHKENMAWLATAFYVTGIISIAFASRRIIDEHCIRQTISCVFTVVAAMLALCFICWQFRERRMAANNVLNIQRRLVKKGDDYKELIKFDDPPTYWMGELLSLVTILGATTVAILIFCIR